MANFAFQISLRTGRPLVETETSLRKQRQAKYEHKRLSMDRNFRYNDQRSMVSVLLARGITSQCNTPSPGLVALPKLAGIGESGKSSSNVQVKTLETSSRVEREEMRQKVISENATQGSSQLLQRKMEAEAEAELKRLTKSADRPSSLTSTPLMTRKPTRSATFIIDQASDHKRAGRRNDNANMARACIGGRRNGRGDHEETPKRVTQSVRLTSLLKANDYPKTMGKMNRACLLRLNRLKK